jgi:hypothetical protein
MRSFGVNIDAVEDEIDKILLKPVQTRDKLSITNSKKPEQYCQQKGRQWFYSCCHGQRQIPGRSPSTALRLTILQKAPV